MPLPIYVVDAFTIEDNKPFTGNPAAVCLLEYDNDITDEQKQNIASEMNLSETAFVSHGWTEDQRLTSASGSQLERRTLRWFTRTIEVPLCGHATVASAKILHTVEFQGKGDKTISFESKYNGKLGATISEKEGTISLNFPANPTHSLNVNEYPWVTSMVETVMGENFSSPLDVIKDIQYSPGTKILVLRLKDELKDMGLKEVQPNFQGLLAINTGGFINDVIVTVKGPGGGKDKPHFYSRFFGPWDGIDEDPVTGLAHTVLTPYWTRELGHEMGFVGTLFARQLSARGGDLQCVLLGDRVQINGQARVGLKGEIFI